jgi:hypothetical protein
MKSLILIAMFLLAPLPALTQPAPEKPAATDAAKPAVPDISAFDTNGDGKIDATEAASMVHKDPSVTDVMSDVGGVVEAAKSIKGKSGVELALAISMLLAIVFKLMLSLVKVASKNTDWFKSSRGKAALKYSTLGLGALAALGAGVASAVGSGMGWVEVVIIGLAGPGAMVVHEISSLLPGVGKHASVPGSDVPPPTPPANG